VGAPQVVVIRGMWGCRAARRLRKQAAQAVICPSVRRRRMWKGYRPNAEGTAARSIVVAAPQRQREGRLRYIGSEKAGRHVPEAEGEREEGATPAAFMKNSGSQTKWQYSTRLHGKGDKCYEGKV